MQTGRTTAASPRIECVTAGTDETLQTSTAASEVTLEDMAAFTEVLYNEL